MSSKVVMGVVNTFEVCKVFDIKVTSWPIPIWCGVRNTLVVMNSSDSNLQFNMTNERLTNSTCSLSYLSLPSRGWLTIVVNGLGIVKV